MKSGYTDESMPDTGGGFWDVAGLVFFLFSLIGFPIVLLFVLGPP